MQEKRKTTQARNAVHQICISHSVWWAGLTIFFDQWILGTSGGKLKARLLASSPNRWLLGRSHRLRHEACEVSAAIRTVTGRRCRGPSCGPRSKGTGRWVGGRAHLLDKQPRLILLPLLGAFLSMSGLHNENMALWNGLFFLAQKNYFSNTSNQNLHPQQNINRERCSRGAYLCSKSQEQPAASKNSVLSGEDFASQK